MKKLFGRKAAPVTENLQSSRRHSELHTQPDTETNEQNLRSQDSPSGPALRTTQSVPEVDTHSLDSAALSDVETLLLTRDQSLRLQDTYEENFTSYIPFIVRRLRAEAEQNNLSESLGHANLGRITQWHGEEDSDDDRTMVSQLDARSVMHRPTTSYNYKRTLILASELIRNNVYVFPNDESYELFKHLRASGKKLKKNSMVLFDENSNVQRVYSRRNKSDELYTLSSSGGSQVFAAQTRALSANLNRISASGNFAINSVIGHRRRDHSGDRRVPALRASPQSGAHPGTNQGSASEENEQPFSKLQFSRSTVDTRPHIVPLDWKVKGFGLPLFKIVVPYMSIFRRKTPYMIFRKYIEKPKQPVQGEAIEDEQFETYDFCTVHLKAFQHYKRYTFVIKPKNGPEFKVLAFQNNYRSFTDFNYKDTRFRVFGTPIAMAYLAHYNPELKLYIIDKNLPSLMDNLIDKTHGDPSVREKERFANENGTFKTAPTPETVLEIQDPIPHPDNPILLLNFEGASTSTYSRTVPHEMPPFGRFLDACAYLKNAPFLPKKYSEIGKIEVYQDPAEMSSSNHSSSFSVDLDTLVLTSILLTFRETSIRTTVKHPGQSHNSRMGLLTAISLNTGGAINNAGLV